MANKDLSRRAFIHTAGKAGVVAGLSGSVLTTLANTNSSPHQSHNDHTAPDPVPYTQQPLPYAYAALEPAIDAQTMEIHYTKHAATYAKNLAEAVAAEKIDMSAMSVEQLLGSISKYSVKMRNNAGGHYNHSMFWQLMASPGKTSTPSPELMTAINKNFGSMDALKAKFNDAAKARFGSGWAWVVLKNDHTLDVISTPNQDNPLMDIAETKGVPLFGLDVWEHAYYLKYQNKRPDYITAWWTVLNWDYLNKRYTQIA
jgi:superoxide dismutase, Fe-Mn family